MPATISITPTAEQLFPKAYAPVLNQVLSVLGERLEPEAREAVLGEVGRRMAADYTPVAQGKDLKIRVLLVQKVFGELGGLAEVERRSDHFMICGDSCPWGAVTGPHPEACRLAQALVTAISGVPAEVCCEYEPTPRCCFKIGVATTTEADSGGDS